MSRPVLEVADIFRSRGPAWRIANAGHASLGQLKVMSAIESCRTAALGGHVERCEDCAHTRIAYNSCRNRHCPKCQGAAAREWLAEREAELLPVPYYHVVFTLPAPIGDIAYQNKAVIYDLLFKASAETLITIAADPKHLGARIGLTSVLHTWGSAMTHHPHVHIIVPGGGIAPDGQHWISCRPGFFLPVRVLSRLFRRLFLERLLAAHQASRLKFFGDPTHGSPRRDQDRHIMTKFNSRRHPSAALQLRRLSTGDDRARRRATMDSRPVDQSAPRDAGSGHRDRSTGFVTPSIASQTSVQRSSATDRQRRNPHSV